MAELYSSILCKVEYVGDEIKYLTEKISKQNVDGIAWFFLTADSKMWEEKWSEKGIV